MAVIEAELTITRTDPAQSLRMYFEDLDNSSFKSYLLHIPGSADFGFHVVGSPEAEH
jgi:hypothetical protein